MLLHISLLGARKLPELPAVIPHGGILDEAAFSRALYIEQRRTERSGRCFALCHVELAGPLQANCPERTRLIRALVESTRETDIRGWHQAPGTLGVIFTDLPPDTGIAVLEERVSSMVNAAVPPSLHSYLRLSFQMFPDPKDGDTGAGCGSSREGSLPAAPGYRRPGPRALKRAVDIAGSLAALVLLTPLLAVLAAAIKLTSKGPVLFRQKRVGLDGAPFTFLKFRSMYIDRSELQHREYVTRLIAGTAEAQGNTFKLANDPRVTPVGRFLRRTSLDELPQFVNVLLGSMSLVGPRPAIPYEVDCYTPWHKRRFLGIKPGITGLWQVEGRSRTRFDDMVRMDLRYARTWSLWMDLKIMLRTPRAMWSGEGAC